MEDGYEFFARRQLVTLFSAPNYCGDYDNAGGMMTVDEGLMCSFQVHVYLHEHPHLFASGPSCYVIVIAWALLIQVSLYHSIIIDFEAI